MKEQDIASAASLLLANWQATTRIAALPPSCRPQSREDGYAIAAAIERASGDDVAGWKIAATSEAGQRHINVDGPLAGRIFSRRLVVPDGPATLGDNIMRVAEGEFAFSFARDMPARRQPYTVDETMDAVSDLHLAIEIPDSRYTDFTTVGAAQLIADTACASWLCISEPVKRNWRSLDLAAHDVTGHRNGKETGRGQGRAVLGDPRAALAWLVNEVARQAGGVRAGQFVTTGTCIVPIPVSPGDRVTMDYGVLGGLSLAVA